MKHEQTSGEKSPNVGHESQRMKDLQMEIVKGQAWTTDSGRLLRATRSH